MHPLVHFPCAHNGRANTSSWEIHTGSQYGWEGHIYLSDHSCLSGLCLQETRVKSQSWESNPGTVMWNRDVLITG